MGDYHTFCPPWGCHIHLKCSFRNGFCAQCLWVSSRVPSVLGLGGINGISQISPHPFSGAQMEARPLYRGVEGISLLGTIICLSPHQPWPPPSTPSPHRRARGLHAGSVACVTPAALHCELGHPHSHRNSAAQIRSAAPWWGPK